MSDEEAAAVWRDAPPEVFALLLVEVVRQAVLDVQRGDRGALDWLTRRAPELLDLAGLDVQHFRASVAQVAGRVAALGRVV